MQQMLHVWFQTELIGNKQINKAAQLSNFNVMNEATNYYYTIQLDSNPKYCFLQLTYGASANISFSHFLINPLQCFVLRNHSSSDLSLSCSLPLSGWSAACPISYE